MNAAGVRLLIRFFAAASTHAAEEVAALGPSASTTPGDDLAHRAVVAASREVHLGPDETCLARAIFARLERVYYVDLTAGDVPALLTKGAELITAGGAARQAVERGRGQQRGFGPIVAIRGGREEAAA